MIADEVKTRGEKNANIGYNANTGEYVDMYKAGIVDPTKVTATVPLPWFGDTLVRPNGWTLAVIV